MGTEPTATGPRRHAFSMAEVVVSIVIVGGMAVAALNAVGASQVGMRKMSDRVLGDVLARQLISEILQLSYKEPDDAPGFGRESSESGSSRAKFDDVDDYDNWTASSPEKKDGTAIMNQGGWQRSVAVEYVDPDNLTTVVVADQGVKRITVTVTRNGVVVSTLVATRAEALKLPFESEP